MNSIICIIIACVLLSRRHLIQRDDLQRLPKSDSPIKHNINIRIVLDLFDFMFKVLNNG